jgi:hypothetical protein
MTPSRTHRTQIIVAVIGAAAIVAAAILPGLLSHGSGPASSSPQVAPSQPTTVPTPAATTRHLVVVGRVPLERHIALEDSLARSDGLRPLAPIETGTTTTPPGTYSWAFPAYLATDTIFEDHRPGHNVGGDRLPRPDYFRVHHLPSGQRSLLAYTGQESAASLAALDGTNPLAVVLFPVPTDEFGVLVLIPWERVRLAKDRYITAVSGASRAVLDVTVQ